MPNWTSNSLTTTNPEIIAKLRECEATGNDNILDAFVPMPKGLKGISTGGASTADGVYVRKWRVGPDNEILPIPEEESEALIEAHGTDDWYEWSVRNWGTKWDSCYPSFSITDDEAIVTFDTAWSPPEAWLKTLVAAYSEGRTQLAYAEGGMGFFGRTVYVDGELIVEECSDDNFWDPEKSWDDDGQDDPNDMLTVGCRAHIEAYGLHTGG